MLNIYFDMDGVIAKYEPEAYRSKNALYFQPNVHYFKTVPPNRKGLHFLELLCTIFKEKYKTILLTKLNSGSESLDEEHFKDKNEWRIKHCPFLSDEQFIVTTGSKHVTIQHLENRPYLKPTEILIDDYNPNLRAWQNAGGTAIKFCNDINSPDSFSGLQINEMTSIIELIDMFDKIERNYS